MIKFGMWYESFIFAIIFAVIVIIPCVIVALFGKKMINQLGQWPSRTPAIQMTIFIPLVITEILSFFVLLLFYNFFAS